MGGGLQGFIHVSILVDDGLSFYTDHRVCLRVEKGCFRMGVMTGDNTAGRDFEVETKALSGQLQDKG